MDKPSNDTFIELTFASIFTFICIYFLSNVKDLLIPFVIAVVLWYLTLSFANAIQRSPVWKFKLSDKIALLLSVLIGMTIFTVVLYMLSKNIYNVIYYIPKYQANLTKMINNTLIRFNIQSTSLTSSIGLIQKNDFIPWLTTAAQTLTEIISLTGIILVYYIFLMLEYKSFDSKIIGLFHQKRQLTQARSVIDTLNNKLQSYLWIKTLLSLLTAGTAYALLFTIGVDFSEFWACLIFLLNYIPTIGSIIAIVFPCLLTLIQFESWLPFTVIVIGLSMIQFAIGNILEPKVMGESFNLSGLVILLSLVIWGKIWGVTGMFLSVPLTVMAYIIFSQFERTRWIAVLLSADGKTL